MKKKLLKEIALESMPNNICVINPYHSKEMADVVYVEKSGKGHKKHGTNYTPPKRRHRK